MRDTIADQSLAEEQQCSYAHKFKGCALGIAYRQNHRAYGDRRAPVPAEIVEFAEGQKHGRCSAEQEDETERAIEERPRGRGISCQRLVWKVVGIGMCSAGTRSGRSPSRPDEEGGQ